MVIPVHQGIQVIPVHQGIQVIPVHQAILEYQVIAEFLATAEFQGIQAPE